MFELGMFEKRLPLTAGTWDIVSMFMYGHAVKTNSAMSCCKNQCQCKHTSGWLICSLLCTTAQILSLRANMFKGLYEHEPLVFLWIISCFGGKGRAELVKRYYRCVYIHTHTNTLHSSAVSHLKPTPEGVFRTFSRVSCYCCVGKGQEWR